MADSGNGATNNADAFQPGDPRLTQRRRPAPGSADRARRREEAQDSADFPIELLLVFALIAALITGGLWVLLNLGDVGSGGGFSLGSRKVEDTFFDIHVDLAAAFTGQTVHIDFPGRRQVRCEICHATGAVGKDGMQTCPHCDGTGVQTFRVQSFGGMYQTMRQTCSACRGEGKIIKTPCPKCRGSGVYMKDSELSVELPAGARVRAALNSTRVATKHSLAGFPEAHVIRLENEGHQAPHMNNGDVVLRVMTEKHPRFERKGQDLHYVHTISLKEVSFALVWALILLLVHARVRNPQSLLGFRTEITHLDKRTLPLERTEVTGPTTVVEIAGEGMPAFGTAPRGSLFVSFRILFPRSLDKKEKAGAQLRDVLIVALTLLRFCALQR